VADVIFTFVITQQNELLIFVVDRHGAEVTITIKNKNTGWNINNGSMVVNGQLHYTSGKGGDVIDLTVVTSK
jgi:hypothetical protein